jgi:DMSO/TMAO reductase YedYZ molybdopterin-dependent catalytic subunit
MTSISTGGDRSSDRRHGIGLGRMGRLARDLSTWSRRARTDPRHDQRTAALLGIGLGACFSVCFLTGLYSHLAQHPPGWFHLPAQPGGLYRVTQGLHVATGIATIPLLLAKLWAVFPQLFRWPPFTGVTHAVERLALLPLVAGALFQLFSGTANIDLWYPLPLFFPTGHFWVAWLTIGALIVHVGAKWRVTRTVVRGDHGRAVGVALDPAATRSRRSFLALAAAGSAALTVTTVGETVYPLHTLAVLSPRDLDVGAQGFPVNGAAAEAGVVAAATDPGWRLQVTGRVPAPMSLTRAELEAMPQHSADLPIACVEGWSVNRTWTGVRLTDLLDRVGADPFATVSVHSLEHGLYASSEVDRAQAHHPDTLLALCVNGEDLALDHGYPLRLIGPDRPGVMQTKWLSSVEVH